MITLPTGQVTQVSFVRVSLDLLVNLRDTGRLWVLGDPAQRQLVVGLPGYPILGVARKTSQRR
ncbi:hypothetical protein FPZ12_014010 [Amycolatopsis acidicola]|uniref:Uncharacterized protein n=1 Tax=Amycolatopsis acidicola TaxID=2596893 RepID=A0A5N0V5D2_9PSEU|nr:hypothetical protein [Amycolatopsis acidicola]KAA9161619.1 hypothetical protein FPZ12_014010 [Amycolatopsis acidicola]